MPKVFFTAAWLVCLVSLYKAVTILLVKQQMVIDCKPDVCCEYPEEVDLRIVVLTFKRAKSLEKLLRSLDDLELDGDTASLEIRIDRNNTENTEHAETLDVAQAFAWSRGQNRLHL